MNTPYISEFEQFINHFLDEHPEVAEDQRQGRLIWWHRKVDLAQEEKAKGDSVPQDGYGFYYSAWQRKSGKPVLLSGPLVDKHSSRGLARNE